MPTNHGSIEFLKFPNPLYPGDSTRMIKKWLRDSWARRKIVDLQSGIGGLTSNALQYQGDLPSGSIDSTNLAPGIYGLNGYSVSSFGAQYGVLIQFFGNWKTQVMISGPAGNNTTAVRSRRYVTGQSAWSAWA